MGWLHALPRFRPVGGLPGSDEDIRQALASDLIAKIRHFALGPEGTNISQACSRWTARMQIAYKAHTVLCDTPEDSIVAARQLQYPVFGGADEMCGERKGCVALRKFKGAIEIDIGNISELRNRAACDTFKDYRKMGCFTWHFSCLASLLHPRMAFTFPNSL